MNRSELTSFGKLWAGMAELYGKTISDAVIAMAYAALERYDLSDIRRAINAHVADPERGRFLAKPADLILHMDGDPESRALEAWTKVEQAIGRVGPHQDVVFDESAVMACIEDMGGWIDLCGISATELPFKRNEFAKRYKGYLVRPPQKHMPKLLGISSKSNMQHYPAHVSYPILIGDPAKAMLVYESGQQHTSGAISFDQYTKKMPLLQLATVNGEEVK